MAILVFDTGHFKKYGSSELRKSYIPLSESVSCFSEKGTTVFISHKHDELDELSNFIAFLEKTYSVKAYIDANDSEMPSITSGETASNLKKRIVECDKFILLATNAAIASKWCNWELGYGDAKKYPDNIAILPIKPKDISYKGNEYLELYPHITYYNGTENYNTGESIKAGYYIRKKKSNGRYGIEPLESWLKK